MNNYKIGFACHWLDESKNKQETTSFKGTTVKWCTENPGLVNKKLEQLVYHNCEALIQIITVVSKLPIHQRMFRLTSDILPLYSHKLGYQNFYNSVESMNYIHKKFKEAGTLAMTNNVRLSFHPGQFVVLNSQTPGTINNSIVEVEMHAAQAEWMGYSFWHQEGFCINIHAGGKAGGLQELKKSIKRLSNTAKNLLTIENDEFSWSTEELVEADLGVPIVLDVHHHWIHNREYIQSDSILYNRVVETWNGTRPKLHAAMSRIEHIVDDNTLPDINKLLLNKTKTDLRAHSESAHSQVIIDYFLTFLPYSDIMWEGKQKNLDQQIIYNRAIELKILL